MLNLSENGSDIAAINLSESNKVRFLVIPQGIGKESSTITSEESGKNTNSRNLIV